MYNLIENSKHGVAAEDCKVDFNCPIAPYTLYPSPNSQRIQPIANFKQLGCTVQNSNYKRTSLARLV